MPNKYDLIRQALNAAESSIKLAKQLMSEVEQGKNDQSRPRPEHEKVPGVVGIFDGENMITDKGEKMAVPLNYAAKSRLVVGDTLKMIEENGEKRFKQIERVKRLSTSAVLTKKEGKFVAVAQEGRYRILPIALQHLGASVGDELNIIIPEKNLNAEWAAVESLVTSTKTNDAEAVSETEANASEKPAEKVEAKIEEPKPKEVPVEPVEKTVEPSPAPVIVEDDEEMEIVVPSVVESAKEASDEVKEEAKPEVTEEKKPAQIKPVNQSGDESVLLTDEDLR